MSRRNARENNISVPKSMSDRVKRTLKFANNLIDGHSITSNGPELGVRYSGGLDSPPALVANREGGET